jgi:hypothetical protein
MEPDLMYQTRMGQGPKRIAHLEHFSNPDAATYITGIDFYDHPRTCITRLNEMYEFLNIGVPGSDDPLPRPEEQEDKGKGRWGHAYREHWHDESAEARFASDEEMLAYSPLANADTRKWRMGGDCTSEEAVYRNLRKHYPDEWGDTAPEGCSAFYSWYETLFMWPLMTFGYESFLRICLEPEFDRLMDEFAELSRRVFKAMSRLPLHFLGSHDDIVMPTGPVCSPAWMHKHIFPRYEEFWGYCRAAGKRVYMTVDGCIDAFVDDVMACGASGFTTEPFTDFKAIARKYENVFLAGEGDNRILMRNNPDEIKSMVKKMVETAKMSGGYAMCIGNHIPFNVPPEAVKCYFDLSAELGYR